MKKYLLILIILICATAASGQSVSFNVEIVTTYSQNEKFFLKSTPFDNESPSLWGKTYVYEKGKPTPLYVFERGFDSVNDDSNNLILSNDGEVIFYLISWGANEEKEGLKSVSIYKQGKLFKSFTETEITGCDEKKERCDLVYSNYQEVVDKEKSNWGTTNYKKALKEGVDEKERFLSDFPIFSFDDTVYLTDSKKKVHRFDLKEGSYLGSDSFDSIFAQISSKGRFNRTELQRFDVPTFSGFPNLKNGKGAHESLADYLGMKTVDSSTNRDDQYKQYIVEVRASILQNGSLAIEEIDARDQLPKEKIAEFFRINLFDSSIVPEEFEKWYLGKTYLYFRKRDNRLAREERRQEIAKERREFEERLTLESINGTYIPANLAESFVELDKLLPEVDKKEMQALPKRQDMIAYHHGLGTWIRNNWGLWGGSRLQKYFTDKGITHPDSMSAVILEYYHDWLNGKKETWREWEKKPRSR